MCVCSQCSFVDLPMPMLRSFFCEGALHCVHVSHALVLREIRGSSAPTSHAPPNPTKTHTESYCDKAGELVARADYVRFMRWARTYLRQGPQEFRRKVPIYLCRERWEKRVCVCEMSGVSRPPCLHAGRKRTSALYPPPPSPSHTLRPHAPSSPSPSLPEPKHTHIHTSPYTTDEGPVS